MNGTVEDHAMWALSPVALTRTDIYRLAGGQRTLVMNERTLRVIATVLRVPAADVGYSLGVAVNTEAGRSYPPGIVTAPR